jgi:hypothetical protein
MSLGLKNVGATYQRAMNLLFHELLGIIVEVYIDDIVVKSAGLDSHLVDLHLAFEKMCQYGLKMNLLVRVKYPNTMRHRFRPVDTDTIDSL